MELEWELEESSLTMSASQKMVPRYASMKTDPLGACAVAGVGTTSRPSDSAVSTVSEADLVDRNSEGSVLIGLCIRA